MAGETLVPGFRFPERPAARLAAEQAEALRACAIDPQVWAGLAEPTLWGNDGFQAMSAAGQGIDGYIHVEHHLHLTGAVSLGEPVTIDGETVSNEEVPRGRRIVQRFRVRRADGSVAVISEHVRLLPDLARMGPGSGGGARREGVPAEPIATKTLRPEDVTAYSRPVGNEIHFDPAFAARYGYRAPLAQGLMTLTWMVAHVAERVRDAAWSRMVARFRRPVFWDDALSLVGERDGEGEFMRLAALNAEGRVACELTVEAGTLAKSLAASRAV